MTIDLHLSQRGKRLIILGAVLFFIGLLQGLLIPVLVNPRMALSGHTAALQSGMALMILGILWSLLHLQPLAEKIAYYANIIGIYLLWMGIILAAALGAGETLAITGRGFQASPMIELNIQIIMTLGAGLGIIGMFLVVIGLLKNWKSA